MSTSSEQFPAQPAPRPWSLAPEPEPVFGLVAVIFTFVSTLLAIIFCGAIAIVVSRHVVPLGHIRPVDLASDPRVIVPAQLAAYLLVFGVLWRMFSHHFQIGFFRALSWNWPLRWPVFLVGGAVLAMSVLLSSRFLPAPPELPIDKMMRTPADAWLLSIFGVFFAPFVEEVLFRGLLFPALARRAGALFSLLMTSVLFGAIHSQQLAGAWIQVTCIVLVGIVLTVVRWRFRSLASSTLVHVGYNGALFVALFIQTRGFTNFTAR
ncbi:MAG TPA: CPBP family intramembrane glutamic endopeptidase [Candidatus Saccharimonadales bacterium]|nr:CPBP family intramembrane glutamic endopeptidase [Candidatus Saccharimonadales bacterium]